MPRRNTNVKTRADIVRGLSPSVSKVSHLLTKEQMQRKRGLFAYEDGYADAREFGHDGFFMPEEWCEELRLKYLAGFEKGLKVHQAREGGY